MQRSLAMCVEYGRLAVRIDRRTLILGIYYTHHVLWSKWGLAHLGGMNSAVEAMPSDFSGRLGSYLDAMELKYFNTTK